MTTFDEYVEQYEELQDKYGAVLDKAYARGYERGLYDKESGYTNDNPLSGEWAGESVNELLGDIIKQADKLLEEMGEQEDGYAEEEVCAQYETGYQDGNGRW